MNNNQQTLQYILIILAFLAFGVYLIYQKAAPAYDLYNEVNQKTQEYETIKKDIEDIKMQKEAYEKEEKVSTKPVYKNDTVSLDPMSSYGVMFEDVIQSAKYNGLKLRSISYNTAPQNDIVMQNMKNDYNVCEIKMQLIGNYMQFRSYFQDIYNYPYLMNLDKISIKPYENNKRILISDVSIILYSLKNDAQRQAARTVEDLQQNNGDSNNEVPMPGV